MPELSKYHGLISPKPELPLLGDFLFWAETEFESADLYFGHGTDNAWDEAVALASFVLELPPDVDVAVMDQALTEPQREILWSLVEQRILEKIPLPYLTNIAWFAGLKFYVDARVIIPRSAFAELIEQRFSPWLGGEPQHILDLCTGSACMAIATAYAFPKAQIHASELSLDALEIAKKNLLLHNLEQRIQLFHSDLFKELPRQKYDLIISNPPYVSTEEKQDLPEEYLAEPEFALYSGEDGLNLTRQILQQAAGYLNKNGLLIIEVGNSEMSMRQSFPDLNIHWLPLERGGSGIFLMKAQDLTAITMNLHIEER